MDDAKLTLTKAVALYEGLAAYGELLAQGKYEEAEGQRSGLAILWGEMSADVAQLGVPLIWGNAYRQFLTFESALSPFDLRFSSCYFESIRHALASLELAQGKLRRALSEQSRPAQAAQVDNSGHPNAVFVAHGHDEGLLQATARFLERLGLEPIILREMPKEGRTIIEQIEEHSIVRYAVVLLTPDDVGYSAGSAQMARSRPRQNAVFELGYFMGKLGRRSVCALHRGDLELLSNVLGILYIAADSETWKTELVRELQKAGFAIDMNKVLK